jgi:hypothetical protein
VTACRGLPIRSTGHSIAFGGKGSVDDLRLTGIAHDSNTLRIIANAQWRGECGNLIVVDAIG